MSLASLTFGLFSNTRRASNAEFGMMRSARQITQGVRQAGNPNLNFSGNQLKALHDRENNLMAKFHMNNLFRTIANARAESMDKLVKENIKKSFNYMA